MATEKEMEARIAALEAEVAQRDVELTRERDARAAERRLLEQRAEGEKRRADDAVAQLRSNESRYELELQAVGRDRDIASHRAHTLDIQLGEANRQLLASTARNRQLEGALAQETATARRHQDRAEKATGAAVIAGAVALLGIAAARS